MRTTILRYSAAVFLAVFYSFFDIIFSPITIYTTFFLLSFFTQAQLSGITLFVNDMSFSIISACTASLAYLLLAELILMTKGISLKQSLKMFFLGFSAIFSMNILRILFLIFVYVHFGKNYFDAVHLIFWYFVSTFFVIAVWIFLIEKYKIKSVPIYSDIQFILRK